MPSTAVAKGLQRRCLLQSSKSISGLHNTLDEQRLYTSQLYTPDGRIFAANVDLHLIQGKGVGMRVHQDLKSGDLICAFPPLCVLYGPQGSAPDNEALADAILEQQLTPEQLRWLQLLHAGHECQGGPEEQPRLHALRQLLFQQPHSHPTLHHSSPEGEEPSAPGQSIPSTSQGPHTEAAHAAVRASLEHTPFTAAASGQGLPIVLSPPHADPAHFPPQQAGNVGQHAEGVVGEQGSGLSGVQGSHGAGNAHGSEDGFGHGAGSGAHGAQGGGVPGPDATQDMHLHGAAASNRRQSDSLQRDANPHLPAGGQGGLDIGAEGSQDIGINGTDPGGLSMQEVIGTGEAAGSGFDVSRRREADIQQAKVATRAWVLEALACHTLGDSCEDVAVAQLRQQEPLQSYCGLWPEFALLNHSCSPNTVHLVVGGWLLLRAARPIAEGAELTTCHIGAGRFQHVASRRSRLQREFGFHCACGRCTLEHHFYPTRRYTHSSGWETQTAAEDFIVADTLRSRRSWAQVILDGLFGKGRYQTDVARDPRLLLRINQLVLNHLEPELEQAVSATTRLQEKRKSVLAQCLGLEAAVELSLQELHLDPSLAALLRASVFELYQLKVELCDLLPDLVDGPEQVAALKQAVKAADAVARGTEVHVQLSVRMTQKVRACFGGSSTEAREAELACAAAHHARYGRVNPGTLRALASVRLQQACSSSLAQRLGVLAWDDQASRTKEEEGVSVAS
ncbi:hypothetical protein DUNSADRAFT_16609 [Dunaliella salina]|uniref:SET domain-containing protein n=1 Tax=Dunaliella salina TaxID=3046 RepID=A0ABQ7G390_DUNSA|nr:hypothetical protein DUNSADRAFT_16609 [Dunaliella salina]|eukprot:KAF5829076.1 hypothetical protein DUNSADRAFT_16609 [Dunaliella salina]